MSGCSSSTTCPNCGMSCDLYTDSKPFDTADITCYECGFTTYTIIRYMDLEEVNEQREQNGMELLTELPEQKY